MDSDADKDVERENRDNRIFCLSLNIGLWLGTAGMLATSALFNAPDGSFFPGFGTWLILLAGITAYLNKKAG